MGFHLFGFYFGKKKDDIDFSCAYTVRDDQPDILFHTILNIEGCKKHKIQVKIPLASKRCLFNLFLSNVLADSLKSGEERKVCIFIPKVQNQLYYNVS